MSSNLKILPRVCVCSEQEFERLLHRSEQHFKAKRPTELKVVPPPKPRRVSAA